MNMLNTASLSLPTLSPIPFDAQTRNPVVTVPADQLEIRFGQRNTAHYRKLAARTTATRTGHSISDRIRFELITRAKLGYEDIRKIQELKGYHPLGYDFFGPGAPEKLKGGKFKYRWSCAASCD